jgi:hypothetical protein
MADRKNEDNGEHEDNRDRDGHKKDGYDHTKTKDVNESGSGKHSKDDKDK